MGYKSLKGDRSELKTAVETTNREKVIKAMEIKEIIQGNRLYEQAEDNWDVRSMRVWLACGHLIKETQGVGW